MGDKTRIIIADDHPIVRNGLRQAIAAEADFEIVGEASDGERALKLIRELQPHIAVLDVQMPKHDGFAILAEVQKAMLPVAILFLTFHTEAELLHRALDQGAMGYILKDSALMDIVVALRAVADGRPFVSSSLTAALLDRGERPSVAEDRSWEPAVLTPCERRILSRIGEGKATKEIAMELHVQPRTVESHRANICQKLGLSGTNSLLRFVLERKSESSS